MATTRKNGSVLLLDVGNTNTKIALGRPDGPGDEYVLPTNALETPDGFGLKTLDVCRHAGVDSADIQAWTVCSVVPPLDGMVRRACARFFGSPCLFVGKDISVPLENRYERPGEVGADRLVTAYAARVLFDEPDLVAVDFGTATTFDCVSGRAYVGGLICPGLLSSLRALATGTAKLPRIDLTEGSKALTIGQNTVTSLSQGMVHGFAAMVEGLKGRLGRAMGRDTILLVATGGFSSIVAAVCPAIDHLVGNLLLQGLNGLYFDVHNIIQGEEHESDQRSMGQGDS
ncbi:MAG: type III pantothenate kinase [Deltaproteobacteria bacterium]|nr:type III pantothenate kinase [Deltaproteobacteria bacterium]